MPSAARPSRISAYPRQSRANMRRRHPRSARRSPASTKLEYGRISLEQARQDVEHPQPRLLDGSLRRLSSRAGHRGPPSPSPEPGRPGRRPSACPNAQRAAPSTSLRRTQAWWAAIQPPLRVVSSRPCRRQPRAARDPPRPTAPRDERPIAPANASPHTRRSNEARAALPGRPRLFAPRYALPRPAARHGLARKTVSLAVPHPSWFAGHARASAISRVFSLDRRRCARDASARSCSFASTEHVGGESDQPAPSRLPCLRMTNASSTTIRAARYRAGWSARSVTRGRPAELDGQKVVEIGTREGAVPFAGLGDRQPRSEGGAQIAPDPLRLVCQPIAQQPAAKSGRERLLVRRTPDDSVDGSVRARIAQLYSTIASRRSLASGTCASSFQSSASCVDGSTSGAMAISITPSSRPRLPPKRQVNGFRETPAICHRRIVVIARRRRADGVEYRPRLPGLVRPERRVVPASRLRLSAFPLLYDQFTPVDY